jgi:hypothetical protein
VGNALDKFMRRSWVPLEERRGIRRFPLSLANFRLQQLSEGVGEIGPVLEESYCFVNSSLTNHVSFYVYSWFEDMRVMGSGLFVELILRTFGGIFISDIAPSLNRKDISKVSSIVELQIQS